MSKHRIEMYGRSTRWFSGQFVNDCVSLRKTQQTPVLSLLPLISALAAQCVPASSASPCVARTALPIVSRGLLPFLFSCLHAFYLWPERTLRLPVRPPSDPELDEIVDFFAFSLKPVGPYIGTVCSQPAATCLHPVLCTYIASHRSDALSLSQ